MTRHLKHPLKAFRDGNKLRQYEAAALVGIPQATWSRLERGLQYVEPRLAKRISDLTGIKLELLINLTDKGSVPDAVECPEER